MISTLGPLSAPVRRTPPKAPVQQNSVRFEGVTAAKKAEAITPSPQQMEKDVAYLCSLLRNPDHMDELNKAADYVKKQWQDLGLNVVEQTVPYGDREFRNITVSFGPPDAERFVVGAHYDVYLDLPGADDNASGVAGLLELSRQLVKHKPQLNKRLDLVAFTLEEPPYGAAGSYTHAQSLFKSKVPVKGMISLEMIGYYSDEKGSQRFPNKLLKWLYPSKGNFIGVIGFGGKALGLTRKVSKAIRRYSQMPARALWVPSNMFGVDRSDHAHYTAAGFPAVMITDTAEHRNANYHHDTDTIEKLSFDKMAEVVKGVYGLVTHL